MCWQHGTLARRSCPLPRVWPFLLILKEQLLVGLRPGRKLEPHQCHQDSDAHHPAGDEPGDRDGRYLVPVKVAVQRAEAIGEGAIVEVVVRLNVARRE